jgi:hypothetical protein
MRHTCHATWNACVIRTLCINYVNCEHHSSTVCKKQSGRTRTWINWNILMGKGIKMRKTLFPPAFLMLLIVQIIVKKRIKRQSIKIFMWEKVGTNCFNIWGGRIPEVYCLKRVSVHDILVVYSSYVWTITKYDQQSTDVIISRRKSVTGWKRADPLLATLCWHTCELVKWRQC